MKANRRDFPRRLSLVTVISMALCGPVYSQDISSTQATAGAQEKTRKVEEMETIVVTATKREKSLNAIPASIAPVSGDELEQHGAQNFQDVVKLVPGINVVTPADNAARITIRGIAGEANTNPTAGVLFGDVSFLDSYVPTVTLDLIPFDLQDVEVLKGPQGTLFGAGALNGAIRYVPNAPDYNGYSGKYFLESSIVQDGGFGFGGGMAVNLPIGKDGTSALRLTGYGMKAPGYVDNDRTGQRNANWSRLGAFRGIWGWKPVDPLEIKLTYSTQHSFYNDGEVTDNFEGLLKADNRPRRSPRTQNYDLVDLSAKYAFGFADLVSETSYLDKRFNVYTENSWGAIRGSPYPIAAVVGHGHTDSWSQEFRLVSHPDADSPWSWVTGVYASNQDIKRYQEIALGDPSLDPAITQTVLNGLAPKLGDVWSAIGKPPYNGVGIDVQVKELAAFFDVSRKFGSHWEAEFGGRAYHTTSGGAVHNAGLVIAYSDIATGAPLDPAKLLAGTTNNDRISESGFSPKLSLMYHFDDQNMLYAAASRGFRVGGPQWGLSGLFATRPAPSLFKSDTIWNYELGWRGEALERRVNYSVTAFRENWTNPQILVLDPTGLGSYIDNVGKVVSKGVEGALWWRLPVTGMAFKTSATFTDAKTTQPFQTAVKVNVPAGTRWPLAPQWQSASTLSYDTHLSDTLNAGGYVSHTFVGRANYGITQPSPVFGYNLFDAQVHVSSYSLPTSPEVSFTLSNITNKHGINTAYQGAAFETVSYVRPRTYMLRLSGTF